MAHAAAREARDAGYREALHMWQEPGGELVHRSNFPTDEASVRGLMEGTPRTDRLPTNIDGGSLMHAILALATDPGRRAPRHRRHGYAN